MSQQFYIVVNQVLIFGILMLIGFVMAKGSVLTTDVLNGLSKLIVKLLLPCLIISLILENQMTLQKIGDQVGFIVALLLLAVSLCFLGFAMAGASGLRRSGRDMFVVATMFCNIGFLGVPLIESMFPGNQLVHTCLLIYIVVDQLLLWSVGLFLCTWHAKRKQVKHTVQAIVNPMMLGIVLALVIVQFHIPVPTPVMTAIQGLGDCSRYLALLYLGALLASMSVVSALTRPYVYFLIVIKMTTLPILTYVIAGLFFDHTVSLMLATIVSLPSMVAGTMMARTYGGDERVAAEMVFVSTIACLGTIPLVQFLLHLLM